MIIKTFFIRKIPNKIKERCLQMYGDTAVHIIYCQNLMNIKN